MENRWIINRIGLVNFWYYDEEEFHFSGGRLLLRGANGSGKSVTMQSFIPLMLDGNKSPERLDPFGSRARKIENYLLGEEDSGENERTGYLYMEFCKEKTGNYLTLGIGLHAKRGRSLDFWGFSLTDGRRVGRDFFLYKNLGEKVPLTKQELKNRIGEGGEVHERQKDYMCMVNRLLFGFENIEDYDELIKLLVQLRTPKLSKDFKPTVIYDILTNSLQPLSDDDLRPMSEAIENMDNIKNRLDLLTESRKAATRLGREFDKYNTYLLWEKARNYLQSHKEVSRKEQEEQKLEESAEEYLREHLAAEKEVESLKAEQEALELKRRELMQHDSFRLREEMEKREKDLTAWKEEKRQKEETLAAKTERENRLRTEISRVEEELYALEKSMDRILTDLAGLAGEIYFDEHFFMQDELRTNLSAKYSWDLIKKELQRYRERIREVLKKLQAEKEQNRVYDRAYGELEAAKREREEARINMEKAEKLLYEIKEEFIEKVYLWKKANRLLQPGEEELVLLQRLVNAYPDKSFDDILTPLREIRQRFETRLFSELSRLEAEKNGRQEKLQAKEDELAEWLRKKEPEPERERKVLLNRERLAREGIPFIPFYQAVDFKEEVPEELRGRIEEALESLGILDALIVPEEFKDRLWEMDPEAADSYLFPRFQLMTVDLSCWLRPVTPPGSIISEETVDSVLRSIIAEEDSDLIYLTEGGRFGVGGVLKGQVSAAYQGRFIGSESRRRYREEVIAGLREEIKRYQEEISRIEAEIAEVEEKRRVLEAEFKAFPGKDDLEAASLSLREAQLTLENKVRLVEEKTEYVDQCYRLLQKLREEIRGLTFKMEIPVTLESFTEAEKRAQDYADHLRELETEHSRYLGAIERRSSLNEHLFDLGKDLDDLRYDLGRISLRIEREEKIIRHYQEMLAEMDYQSIKAQIDECIARLEAIPTQRDRAVAKSKEGKVKAEQTKEKLASLKRELFFRRQVNQIHRNGFEQELALGYVMSGDDGDDILSRAQEVYDHYQEQQKEGKSREDYLAALQERYFEVRHELTEYNLVLDYIFGDPRPEVETVKKEQAQGLIFREQESQDLKDSDWDLTPQEKEELAAARHSLRRLDIRARIQGKDVNFFTLVTFLEESIAENEKLLRESDRQLFEDILANTVSKKIRSRIYHSEQWVEKMNNLMAAMNTSSGLTFNLVWKSRAAESEEQMDTRELVEILKSDVNLLRPEDFQKLAAHFRSKIAQARKGLEEAGVTKTFHTLIKEILDYRQWFEFQLFYTKTGERKRELTNNAFDRFSGGEKAMAMYVPLFSAVYARYEGARPDAPRLISLDEAFAGVDENNIRDMFRLLEELELNFIINSQILWGDYDTVPALAICELIRPNNAQFVSVIRYRWNGRVRELITEEAG